MMKVHAAQQLKARQHMGAPRSGTAPVVGTSSYTDTSTVSGQSAYSPLKDVSIDAQLKQHLALALKTSQQTPGPAAAAQWRALSDMCEHHHQDFSKLMDGQREDRPLLALVESRDSASCAAIGSRLGAGNYGLLGSETKHYAYVSCWLNDQFKIALAVVEWSQTHVWQMVGRRDGSWVSGDLRRNMFDGPFRAFLQSSQASCVGVANQDVAKLATIAWPNGASYEGAVEATLKFSSYEFPKPHGRGVWKSPDGIEIKGLFSHGTPPAGAPLAYHSDHYETVIAREAASPRHASVPRGRPANNVAHNGGTAPDTMSAQALAIYVRTLEARLAALEPLADQVRYLEKRVDELSKSDR